MDQARLNQLRHEDRKQLDALLEATNGAMNALRRDECGDWTITGSRGTIRACNPEGSGGRHEGAFRRACALDADMPTRRCTRRLAAPVAGALAGPLGG